MPGLLYYPKIMPPAEVMYRSVLYWDFVATIVPGAYEGMTTEGVRRLRDEGLYYPVRIEGPKYDEVLPERFFTELAVLMDKVPVDELVPAEAEEPETQGRRFLERELYRDKLSLFLMSELEHLGLARRDRDSRTVWVSPAIAELLFDIAIERVAEVAGTDLPSGLFTCTDDERSYWTGHRPVPPRDRWRSGPNRRVAVSCWQADIGQLLPVPAPGTPVQDVIRFRRQHESERIRLVTAIGDLQNRLREWSDDPRDILAQVSAELGAAEHDLTAAGTAAKLKLVRRSMYVFIAMAAATSTAAATSLLEAPGLALPTVTSALSVAGGLAVNLATNQIATAEGAQPFSYLHLTKEQFA